MNHTFVKLMWLLLFSIFTSCGSESRQGQYFISNSISVATKGDVIVCKLHSGLSDREELIKRGVTSAWIEYRHQIDSSIDNIVIDSSRKVLVLKVEKNALQLLEELQGADSGSFGLYSGDRIYKVDIGDQSVYKISLGAKKAPIVIALTCR